MATLAANLERARKRNAKRDWKYLQSFKMTFQRLEAILRNRNIFLDYDRKIEMARKIRAGTMRFDYIRDQADRWEKDQLARVMEANRGGLDNDLRALRGGYDAVLNRVKSMYRTRGLTLDDEDAGNIARNLTTGRWTFETVRNTAERLYKEMNPAANLPKGEDTETDVEPFDYKKLAKSLFPFLPQSLIDAYATGWDETGDPETGLLRMREHADYDRYFPGNKLAPGQFALSEADYIAYRQQARDLMRDYGLPPEYFDRDDDVGKLVAGQVRLSQLEERIRNGYVVAMQANPEVREELQRTFGFGIGDMAAFWLDPSRGEDLLRRKLTEAQIRAEARTTGYGAVSMEDSELLAQYGVDLERAREGFGELVAGRGLFEGLVGSTEEDIEQRDQFGAVFLGDAEARERLRRRQESRAAAFGGGGGAAGTQEGYIGLRTAE